MALAGGFDSQALVDAASSAGIAIRAVAGRDCRTPNALFSAWAAALGFFDYFGHNWDALDECLCDHDFQERVPTLMVVRDADLVLEGSPEERGVLVQVLDSVDAGKQESGYHSFVGEHTYPPFWILLLFSDENQLSDFEGLMKRGTVLVAAKRSDDKL